MQYLGGIYLIHVRMNRIQIKCEEGESGNTRTSTNDCIIRMHERTAIAGCVPLDRIGQCNSYESNRISMPHYVWSMNDTLQPQPEEIYLIRSIHGIYISFSLVSSFCVHGARTKEQIQQSDHFTVPFCHIVPGEHEPSRFMYVDAWNRIFSSSQHGTREKASASQLANRSKIKLMILCFVLSTAVSAAVVGHSLEFHFILFISFFFFVWNINSGWFLSLSLSLGLCISHAICKPKARKLCQHAHVRPEKGKKRERKQTNNKHLRPFPFHRRSILRKDWNDHSHTHTPSTLVDMYQIARFLQ